MLPQLKRVAAEVAVGAEPPQAAGLVVAVGAEAEAEQL
jgi:hypothetical protein